MPLEESIARRLDLIRDVPSWEAVAADPTLQARLADFAIEDDDYILPQVTVDELTIMGPHGAIPLRVYRPSPDAAARPSLVWCHGGGFTEGDLDMNEAHMVAAEVCSRAEATVISVDYHLATAEVHYPVPVDDLVAAIRWASGPAAAYLGIDVRAIHLGGASAGATLSAGTALRLRDEQGPVLQSLVLAYPLLHQMLPPSAELGLLMNDLPPLARSSSESIAAVWTNYLGPGITLPSYAVPASMPLSGLPPTLVIAAEYDDLRSSAETFTEQLRAADVNAQSYLAVGMVHGHLNRTPAVAEVDRTLSLISKTINPAQ